MGDKYTETNMGAMLTIRMGWNVSCPPCTLRKMSALKLNDDEAVVFVVTDANKALLILDDLSLFPSDALVTQLRLLEKT